MINFKKRYKKHLLTIIDIWQIQFFLGALLCLFVVGILTWGTNWHNWLAFDTKTNSLTGMGTIYLFSFISVRRFSVYLGQLSLPYIASIFFLWSGVVLGIIFIFRLPYSVYFLVFSCLVMLIFFVVTSYLNNRDGQRIIAYVPVGRIENLPEQNNITWKKLTDCKSIDRKRIDMVMADLRADLSDEWEHFLAECTLRHIPVYHSARLIEMASGRVRIDHMYENELGSLLPSKSYQLTKRFLDITLIIASIPFVLPVILITGLLIAIESRGGVFFLQERVGQGGVLFTMYKFRSMYSGTATDKTTGDSDSRITRIGRFIRKTRIDELPQFYNVLRGEMSLIGPRAEFYKFAEQYEKEIPFYSYRHIVKPGISGWAQVTQGYNFGVDDTKVKLEYDFYYIKNFSFSMDLLIFFKTIQTMLTGFGAR